MCVCVCFFFAFFGDHFPLSSIVERTNMHEREREKHEVEKSGAKQERHFYLFIYFCLLACLFVCLLVVAFLFFVLLECVGGLFCGLLCFILFFLPHLQLQCAGESANNDNQIRERQKGERQKGERQQQRGKGGPEMHKKTLSKSGVSGVMAGAPVNTLPGCSSPRPACRTRPSHSHRLVRTPCSDGTQSSSSTASPSSTRQIRTRRRCTDPASPSYLRGTWGTRDNRPYPAHQCPPR